MNEPKPIPAVLRLRTLVAVAMAAAPAFLVVACGGELESSEDGATTATLPPSSSDGHRDGSSSHSDAARRDGFAADAKIDLDSAEPEDPIGPAPEGSLADGVCNHPTGYKNLFDPDCIYVVGTFAEGESESAVIFEPSHPKDQRGGVVDYGIPEGIVRPSDNRLLYGAQGVRIFTQDALLVSGHFPADTAAAANDPLLSTPACPSAAKLWGIFPDDDVLVYGCTFGPTYLEGSTVPIAGLERGFDALGPARTALVIRASNGPKVWKNGVDVPIDSFPNRTVVGARYGGDGKFFVAVYLGGGPLGLEQWTVSVDGVAAFVGVYQNPQNLVTGSDSALDPAGNLIRLTTQGLHDRLMRFSVTSPPVVFYDEEYADGGKKPIRLHAPSLLTGP